MNGTKECGESFSHDPKLMTEGPMGNVYFRPMRFEKKGQRVEGHKHNFDHVTFVWRGSVEVRVWKDGESRDDAKPARFSAPAKVFIARDRFHEFTALEDGTLADCIYAIRDGEGQVTDTWDGRMTPYV